jgi:hypothetical protein
LNPRLTQFCKAPDLQSVKAIRIQNGHCWQIYTLHMSIEAHYSTSGPHRVRKLLWIAVAHPDHHGLDTPTVINSTAVAVSRPCQSGRVRAPYLGDVIAYAAHLGNSLDHGIAGLLLQGGESPPEVKEQS